MPYSLIVWIIMTAFLLLLILMYALFRYHLRSHFSDWLRARPPGDFVSRLGVNVIPYTGNGFGELFRHPNKDGHEWNLLMEMNGRCIWICNAESLIGYWTMKADGTAHWQRDQRAFKRWQDQHPESAQEARREYKVDQ